MSKLEELERRFKAHKQVRAGAYNWQNFAEVLLAALRESEADRQLERDQTETEQADNARLRAAIEAQSCPLNCDGWQTPIRYNPFMCNCWKRAALEGK